MPVLLLLSGFLIAAVLLVVAVFADVGPVVSFAIYACSLAVVLSLGSLALRWRRNRMPEQ